MDTEQNWKQMDGESDEDLSRLLDMQKIAALKSNNPLHKIKKNLVIHMAWGIAICILYVVVIFKFNIWQVQACLGAVLCYSVWALIISYIQYKNIRLGATTTATLLEEMKRNHLSISQWKKVQLKAAIFIYPVSAAGGFMLGGVVGSGKTVAQFLSKPAVPIIMLITIAILAPACHYLAKWMTEYSFGKHVAALEKNIKELENEK
jgi:hypothetical protein